MSILEKFTVIDLIKTRSASVATITGNVLKFNNQTAGELHFAPYIQVLINPKDKQFAIRACKEDAPNAVPYSAESFSTWQRTAGSAADRTGATGFDGYNGELTGDVSSTLGVNCGMSTGRNGIVLNDQGGNRMDVTDEVTATLRAEAHHPPVVMDAAGFCTEHSSKSRSIGYEEETSPTLRAGVVPATVYENHSQDTRYTGPVDTAPTVSATYGMGGNNQPFVVSGDQPFCNWDGDQVAPTLTAHNAGGNQRMPDKNHFNCVLQAFGISSKDSKGAKSTTPSIPLFTVQTRLTIGQIPPPGRNPAEQRPSCSERHGA